MRKSITVRKYNNIDFFFNGLQRINYNIVERHFVHIIYGIEV